MTGTRVTLPKQVTSYGLGPDAGLSKTDIVAELLGVVAGMGHEWGDA